MKQILSSVDTQCLKKYTDEMLRQKLSESFINIKKITKNSINMYEFSEKFSQLHNDLNSPLKMMIMGGFSVGKSTFINALLRREVTTVNATPTTAVITKLLYGDSDKMYVHFKNGNVQEYTINKFAEMTAEFDKSQKEFHNSIKYVERTLPIDFLKEYTIIDTPGLNSAQDDHTDATVEVMNEADLVVWLFDARWAAGKADIDYMHQLDERIKPLIVVNQMDYIDDEEDDPDEFLADVAAKCGDNILDIVGISAKFAIDGIRKNNKNLEVAGNIQDFFTKINEKVKPQTIKFKFEKMMESYIDYMIGLLNAKKKDDAEIKLDYSADKSYGAYVYAVEQAYNFAILIQENIYCVENSKKEVSRFSAVHERIVNLLNMCNQYLQEFLSEHSTDLIKAIKERGASAYRIAKNYRSDRRGYVRSIYWYNIAYNSGIKDAAGDLADLYVKVKNWKSALEWYIIFANNGDAESVMTVAMVLYNGEGNVKPDKVKAEEWLEKAIMMNTHSRCNEANFDLANILFSHGDENNLKRGWQLLNFAGKHYYKPAIKMIADIYYCGKYNITQDKVKAFLEYKKIENYENISDVIKEYYQNNNYDLQSQFAKWYEYGENGFPQYISEAKKWYEIAGLNNHADSCYQYGRILRDENDINTSSSWLYRAIRLGSMEAIDLQITNERELKNNNREIGLQLYRLLKYIGKLNFSRIPIVLFEFLKSVFIIAIKYILISIPIIFIIYVILEYYNIRHL